MQATAHKIKHIRIIADNGEDHIVADIAQKLGDAGINIESLDAEEVAGRGLIQLGVDRYDDALNLLREAGYQAMAGDALVVLVEDKPGALARIAQQFKDAAIVVRSMRILSRNDEGALVAIVAEKCPEALRLVKDIRVA